MVISYDIIKRPRAELERQVLLEIMEGLAATEDLQEFLKLVHLSIAKIIYAENFFIVFYNKATNLFEEIYSVDKYDPPSPPSKLEKSISAYVFRTGEPLLLTQVRFDKLVARGEVELIGTNSPSWLGIPLRTANETIGVMVMQDYEEPDRYSEHDKDLIASIAGQVAIAIERKQMDVALRRSFEESKRGQILLFALNNVIQAVQRAHTAEDAYREIGVGMSNLGYQVWVLELTEDRTGLSIAYTNMSSKLVDTFEKLTGLLPGTFRVPLISGSFLQDVVWTGKTASMVVDAREIAKVLPIMLRPLAGRIAQTLGTNYFICVPLITSNTICGLLSVSAPHLSQADVPAITTFAAQASIALENAKLFKQTEQRLQRIAALRAIDSAISSNFGLEHTLQVILDQVIKQLSVDASNILLLDPESKVLKFGGARGFQTTNIRHAHLRLGQGHAGIAALNRKTVSVSNLNIVKDHLFNKELIAQEGFVAYYGVPLISKGKVVGVLEIFHRQPLKSFPDWLDYLETIAGQAAIAIDSSTLFNDLQRSNQDLSLAYDATIAGWSRALDLRDKETEGHTQRVTTLTVLLARGFGLSEDEIANVRRGALLHDIGKMGIPDSILLKPSPLTDEEWTIMRQHPIFAYEMISPIDYLQAAMDIPYCHHEKWDGTGYPRGLRGEEIPLAARIFAVVDVWDALRSDRPYRKAWTQEQAIEHIRSLAGTHFDPRVVDITLNSGIFGDLELIEMHQGRPDP